MPRFTPGADLTPKDIKVLQLVSDGYSLKRVAEVLGNTYETVRWQLVGIRYKLEVESTEDAILKAKAKNLIT